MPSLDSIRNQVTNVSNSLKEVFEEDERDPSELGAQVLVAKDRVDTLNKLVEDQKTEIQKLKERNEELHEQKEVPLENLLLNNLRTFIFTSSVYS